MTVGERIKTRREALGLSADKLAEMVSKNRATIFRYENGYIEDIPISMLSRIASALNTTEAFLMGWVNDPEVSKEEVARMNDPINREIIRLTSALPTETQLALAGYVRTLSEEHKEKASRSDREGEEALQS